MGGSSERNSARKRLRTEILFSVRTDYFDTQWNEWKKRSSSKHIIKKFQNTGDWEREREREVNPKTFHREERGHLQ